MKQNLANFCVIYITNKRAKHEKKKSIKLDTTYFCIKQFKSSNKLK